MIVSHSGIRSLIDLWSNFHRASRSDFRVTDADIPTSATRSTFCYIIRPSSNIFPTPTLTLSPARRLAGSPPRTAAPSPVRAFLFCLPADSRGGVNAWSGRARGKRLTSHQMSRWLVEVSRSNTDSQWSRAV